MIWLLTKKFWILIDIFLAKREFFANLPAASVAGLRKMAKAGKIKKGSLVVCILTGHGLKDPDCAISQGTATHKVPCKVEAIIKKLGY